MARVIKHSTGSSEQFDKVKLHTSIEAACLSVRSPEGEAALVARRVANTVYAWADSKPAVTSADIRRVAASLLNTFHPEAAYLYQNHRLVM
ncbi:MAG: ATP cone domain-containing protein [Candidatus Saccharimonadales bacterium]